MKEKEDIEIETKRAKIRMVSKNPLTAERMEKMIEIAFREEEDEN